MWAWLPNDRRDRLTVVSGIYLVVAVPLAFNQAAHDTAIWEKLAVLHVIVLRFCLGWALGETRLRRFALDVPALALLAWVAVSWTQAINPTKSGLEVIRVLLAVALYAAVARTYRPSFLKPWAAAMGVTLGAVSVIGIGQYLGFEITEVRSAGYPSATFWYRNFAAMYVISVLPVTVARLVFADSDREASVWSVASGLGMLFLIYTRTRGAWVGLLGALIAAAVFWFSTRARRRWSIPSPSAPRQALFATAMVIVFVGASFPPIGELVGEQMAGTLKTGIGAAAMSIRRAVRPRVLQFPEGAGHNRRDRTALPGGDCGHLASRGFKERQRARGSGVACAGGADLPMSAVATDGRQCDAVLPSLFPGGCVYAAGTLSRGAHLGRGREASGHCGRALF